MIEVELHRESIVGLIVPKSTGFDEDINYRIKCSDCGMTLEHPPNNVRGWCIWCNIINQIGIILGIIE
uniref:Uncharacterized protein n=1 Tax=viral metagenome TaxID=1070528 RepID=A0A6H2A0W6_9ZZZZ